MTDVYAIDPGDPQPPLAAAELAARQETDRTAEPQLDPLDEWPDFVLSLLWVQEGARLVAREEQVRTFATEQGWDFAAMAPLLSGHLTESDVTADTPRVVRNACRRGDPPGLVCDLTGITFDFENGHEAEHLRLRAGGAALVSFHGRDGHRIVVQPARSASTTWERFGPGTTTESPDFDTSFHVHARDATWATLVLNPSVIQALLAHRDVTLIVSGGYLTLVRPGFLPTEQLRDLLELADRIAYSAAAAAWRPPPS